MNTFIPPSVEVQKTTLAIAPETLLAETPEANLGSLNIASINTVDRAAAGGIGAWTRNWAFVIAAAGSVAGLGSGSAEAQTDAREQYRA